jgi:hypothetical protein
VIATVKDTSDLSSCSSNEVQVVDPAPQVSLGTSSLDFGAKSVGSIGSARTLTVTNTGGRDPLNIGAIRQSDANLGASW